MKNHRKNSIHEKTIYDLILLVSWLKTGNDILGSREACPMVVLGIASVAPLSRNDRGRGKAIINVIAKDRRECGNPKNVGARFLSACAWPVPAR